MKIVHSNEIIGEMITWATTHNSPVLKDLWILSDFIGGLDRDFKEIHRILESFDQSKEKVKILRRELGI
jgi:hypothetical protein